MKLYVFIILSFIISLKIYGSPLDDKILMPTQDDVGVPKIEAPEVINNDKSEKELLSLLKGILKQEDINTGSDTIVIINPGQKDSIFNEIMDSLSIEISKLKLQKMQFGITHEEDVYTWQLYSSKWIFIIVIFIVIIGIIFSAIQFVDSIRKSKEISNSITDTEITASLTEVKIKSSLIGLLILIVSILFLFLYLHFIYPITVV